ncbi:uncharacterized protein [Choristoneura fumiferana]|uniref:uncharacterized protein n=1 Tax=Choristoneura fumiferana TaxID=7141 RepID=UPI003D1544DC
MYRTVYYCLIINLIAVHGFSGFDCSESNIIVTEKYCKHENTTQFTMHTLIDDILHASNLTAATLASNGCPLEFEGDNFNNTFYVECETEINCLDDDKDAVRTINTYYLECEDISLFDDNSTHNLKNVTGEDSMYVKSDKITKDSEAADTRKLIIIASSLAAGIGVVGIAAALYHLQTILQSGSYLFPSTPSPAGFSEIP